MKKVITKIAIIAALVMTSTSLSAQTVTASEPDSVNVYCILTSDSTCDVLLKEMGEVKPHRNKVSKITRIVKKAAGSEYILDEIIIESSQHIVLITSLV